jgi:MFS family permease
LRTAGSLRAIWLIGLAFVRPGAVGLVTVMVVELAVIISMSLYNPVLATYRLEHTPSHQIARTLSAWSISTSASIAVFTALGGVLADLTSTRTALAVAGLAVLTSPLLLPRLRTGSAGVEDSDACAVRDRPSRSCGGLRTSAGSSPAPRSPF